MLFRISEATAARRVAAWLGLRERIFWAALEALNSIKCNARVARPPRTASQASARRRRTGSAIHPRGMNHVRAQIMET
jgi:hypothetical protein